MTAHYDQRALLLLAIVLVPPTLPATQTKECDSGKVFGCVRKCYPTCNETTTCPEIAYCANKECQCPKGKVASDSGECIDLDNCTEKVRIKRQPRRPFPSISIIIGPSPPPPRPAPFFPPRPIPVFPPRPIIVFPPRPRPPPPRQFHMSH
ncbi:hypothetical protein OESDEN_06948 [Oesophagostomum dentatum]|uniref:TIL domain-containing protein n=1 Tax=Oesophagostomum dentatum TaxID=61180 RepID=A0A0B1TAM3_OESDE|nr:hypothetical protein OESDEN_06948 [Oesophagostomum dentatum]